MTHGGFGYAKEFHVERYLRESLIPRIAPISPQLILSFIAEKVLGLPKFVLRESRMGNCTAGNLEIPSTAPNSASRNDLGKLYKDKS